MAYDPDQIWSLSRVAHRHGVSAEQILRWAKFGWMPEPVRRKGNYGFRAGDISRWECAGCPRR